MVKKVEAFEADDGMVFTTEEEALEHEIMQQLKQLDTFMVPTAAAIINHAIEITHILSPLVKYLASQPQVEQLASQPQSESHSNG